MIHSNDDFTPKTVDEQIERCLQLPELRQQEPSAALTQALKLVCEEDAASLARVRERYTARLQAMSAPSIQIATHVLPSHSRRKELAMHNLADKNASMSIQPPSKRTDRPRPRRSVFVSTIAAVIAIGLIAATSLFLFHGHTQTNTGTGSPGSPKVATPTAIPASQIIPKAVLTSPSGISGEGVGPGLSGITSQTQFTVGQQIWLEYIWSGYSSGPVVVKWYVGGSLYKTYSDNMIYTAPLAPGQDPGNIQETPIPGVASNPISVGPGSNRITFDQPVTGKVELYWNGQLAQTLSFVVNAQS